MNTINGKEKITMKKFAIIALMLLSFSSFGQVVQTAPYAGVANYAAVTIPLPLAVLNASTGTNIFNGWSVTNQFTNNIITYTNGAGGGLPGFVTNSVITTNIFTQFAQIDARGQRNVALQYAFFGSGAGTGVQGFDLAKSVDGTRFDSTAVQRVTWAANGQALVTGTTNIPMDGYGFLRIVAWTNADAALNATNILTNYGLKRNAP